MPASTRDLDSFDPALLAEVSALGLQLSVQFDITSWIDWIRTTEWPVANTSVDPAYHDFGHGEVRWLRLSRDNEIVATQVIRRLRIPADRDYATMIEDGTLFRGTGAKPLEQFTWLPGAAELPRVTGTVAQMSGLYIRPEWRRTRVACGLRLVGAFARLTHSYCDRVMRPDWSVSLLEQRVASPRMMYELYGFPHATELFESYVDCFARTERVSIVWMAGHELRTAAESRPQSAARSDQMHLSPAA